MNIINFSLVNRQKYELLCSLSQGLKILRSQLTILIEKVREKKVLRYFIAGFKKGSLAQKCRQNSFVKYYYDLTLIWVGGGGNFTPPVGFPLITQKP